MTAGASREFELAIFWIAGGLGGSEQSPADAPDDNFH
jgi:hypothetical protein